MTFLFETRYKTGVSLLDDKHPTPKNTVASKALIKKSPRVGNPENQGESQPESRMKQQ